MRKKKFVLFAIFISLVYEFKTQEKKFFTKDTTHHFFVSADVKSTPADRSVRTGTNTEGKTSAIFNGYYKFEFKNPKKFMDTSKIEKTIMPQKGIKFYLGLNTGLQILHFKNLWEIAADQFKTIYYSDPSSFRDLRNKSNFYYYFLHGNFNMDIQLKWFVLRKMYFFNLYNLSKKHITLSYGYPSSSFYSTMWYGYSSKYKNRSYYFTVLKGSMLLNLLSAITTMYLFPDLVNGKNVHGKDVVKSNPYSIELYDATGIANHLGRDPFDAFWRSIIILWYFDFGKKISQNWYIGGYVYFQGLNAFNSGYEKYCSPGRCEQFMKSFGVSRFLGINVYYLFLRKNKKK